MEKKVLATVKGKEITESDLVKIVSSMDQQTAMQYLNEQGKARLLGELIAQELFFLEAIDNNLEEEEEFQKELENVKKEMLKRYAARKCFEDVDVSESEVVKYYFENENEFVEPESIKASHILVETEEAAQEALKELNEGTEFEEVAKKCSKCPSSQNGGDLGFFSKGKMVPEFEEAAFALEIGKVSEPVKTQFGYHIIKVTEKKDSQKMKLEDVKEQLTNHVRNLKQAEAYSKKLEELRGKYEVNVLQENL